MRKYYENGVEIEENEFYSELEEAVHRDAEATFDDYLDECYESIEVMGYTFDVSQILKNCDEVAYRQELLTFADQRRELAEEELEYFSDQIIVDGIEFKIEEDDSEE